MRVLFFLQFLILVVDCMDRERVGLVKDELYRMLEHEVRAEKEDDIYLINYRIAGQDYGVSVKRILATVKLGS